MIFTFKHIQITDIIFFSVACYVTFNILLKCISIFYFNISLSIKSLRLKFCDRQDQGYLIMIFSHLIKLENVTLFKRY